MFYTDSLTLGSACWGFATCYWEYSLVHLHVCFEEINWKTKQNFLLLQFLLPLLARLPFVSSPLISLNPLTVFQPVVALLQHHSTNVLLPRSLSLVINVARCAVSLNPANQKKKKKVKEMDKTNRSCCSRTFCVLVCHFDHILKEIKK